MAARRSGTRIINQTVMPRRRRGERRRPQPHSHFDFGELLASARLFVKPAVVLVVVVMLIVGYNVLASSKLFEVRRVEVSGASAPLTSEVEQAVRRAVGQTRLLDVDLATIRQRVESIMRVRSATVARILPDAIYVSVSERQPAILARRQSQSIVWLDDEGVELGEVTSFGSGEEIPPIVKGMSEGNRSAGAMADDRERLGVYRQIEQDLKPGSDSVWHLIDEIDLTFPKNVNIRLTKPPVWIVVGGRDFRKRFETALSVLNAARRGDRDYLSRFPGLQDPDHLIENADSIAFMDVSHGDRIVLSFSTPGRDAKPKPIPPEKRTVRQETKKGTGNRGQGTGKR